MSKLLMLKGLPASGKSTYAKELVAQGWKRLNKDDLRAMIDNGKHSNAKESKIKDIERGIAIKYLDYGENVVIDDTNFVYEDMWRTLAEQKGAEFEVKFFDTPVMECVARDAKRGEKSVGAKVIFGMYDRYLKPKPPEYSYEKQDCYIFDIDGTLAKMNGRSPYDYTKVDTDIPNHNIANIAKVLGDSGVPIIVVSGRENSCRFETEQWLYKNDIVYSKILMRKAGDSRNDAIVKREIYETELKDKYNILAVFDDRNRVVDMWRSLGLTCLQVEYGFF